METKVESCVFISKVNNHLLIVAIIVDDGLIAATTGDQINDVVRRLNDNFETKECGSISGHRSEPED